MTTAATEQQDWDLIPPAVRAKMEELSKFTAPDPNAPTEGEQPPVSGEPATEPEPAQVTPPEPKKDEGSPAPPAEPKSFADVATEEMTKEQRYKIMEGMQKAIGRDLSRAQREAQALREEVEALKQQLSARPTAPVSSPAPAPATTPTEELDSLKEAFGEKNLNDMVKYLRAQGFAVTQDLQQVAQQVGQVSKTVASSAYESFETQMNDFTGNRWKEINVDPQFIAWTQEPEGRTGIPRIEFMKKHLTERNAPLLAQYFQDFEAESGEAPAPAAPARPTLDKKKLAAPKATPAATVLPDGDKPMVKMSEFTKLEADVRAGKYSSDDPVKHAELQNKLLAEQARLNEAQRSNRVVAG